MPITNTFLLPDVGEGLTEADVVAWHVAEGAHVEVNDIIVEIETAKSLVELPSPYAGTVTKLHIAEGQTIPVGSPMLSVLSAADVTERTNDESPADGHGAAPAPAARTAVLVGYGIHGAARRRRRLSGQHPPLDPAVVELEPARTTHRPLAAPPVRLLARQLGVNLSELARRGQPITRESVKLAALDRPLVQADGSRREYRIPVRGVRKASANAVTRSAFTAPHATEWLTVDMTATMNLIRRLKADTGWADARLSPLVLVARALLLTVKRYPEVNAVWDEENQEIVVKEYVHLGIAAATPRGLLVPNIKDADGQDVRELALSLDGLVQRARAGTTPPAEMSGGTITITNIGVFGVDGATPILNSGEAAILAFGAVRRRPWVVGDAIKIRETATLSLSFDHRLVDGALGSLVLAGLAEILEHPESSLLYRG